MPYGRRRRYRRSRGRRRRGFRSGKRRISSRKRMSMRRARLHQQGGFLRLSRAVPIGNISGFVTSTGITLSGDVVSVSPPSGTQYFAVSLSFRLTDLQDYTEVTSLFDQYYLKSVTVKLRPMVGSIAGGGSLVIHSISDFEDDNLITGGAAGTNQMREHWSYQMKSYDLEDHQALQWTVKPAWSTEIYNSAITTRYKSTYGWLQSDYPTVPHYGLKFQFQYVGTATETFSWIMTATYHLACKQLR